MDMGSVISARFHLDNLHITGTDRLDDAGIIKILDALQNLTKIVHAQSKTIDELFEKIAELRSNMTDVHEAVSTPVKGSSSTTDPQLGSQMNSRSDPKVIPLSQRIVPASKGAQPQLRGLSSFDSAAEFFLKTIHGIHGCVYMFFLAILL